MEENRWHDGFNLIKICSKYRVGILQCPQFLFLVMGFVIIFAILVTYEIAKIYGEPEVAALIVLVVSAVLFSIGQVIINSFERMAVSSLEKSEFISIISHQLRSPMSAIKWQLNMLLSDNTKFEFSNEKVYGFLEGIYDQNERMIKSANDLLEINKIEDGDIVLYQDFFSLPLLTEKVIEEYKKEAVMANVKISLFYQLELPQVFVDETRIKRTLEHLINNAIKYSLSGGDINISIEKFGNNILWKITDQGAGIPEKDQKRVFEKFFRSKNVARYKTSGFGAGLFIAKSIIKLSGGTMGFSSTEDKGSTFWFSLPAKKIKQ